MSPYRVILADDHVLVRQGLKRILEAGEALEVIGEAGDGVELLDLLTREMVPDLIILDISMPNLRGIEAVQEIRRTQPGAKILILTMHRDKAYLYQAIDAGVDGYLLKEDADLELFSAIEKIREGKTYLSPHLSQDLPDDWSQGRDGDQRPFSEPGRLTNREKEVLKLIVDGKSNREIAGVLFISARTVENHRARIMEKLNVKNTADLVKYAIQKGYV